MSEFDLSRRGFLKTSAAVTGGVLLSSGLASAQPATTQSAKRSAADQVSLGKTGIRLSRLGIGTGSMNGHVQTELGKEGFAKLIHYAFDQGITYVDCAQAYATFTWIAGAIDGLPREKLFLQSKIMGQPRDILATVDRHRSVFKTDYIDSMLIHCMTRPGWTDDWKYIMDGFNDAREKKWIRAKGVSCHTLPALKNANESDWTEVHLVRVNPMGAFMDGPGARERWSATVAVDPVLDEIKSMHEKGRGIIGMKIIGNGTFTDPADRDKSIRFAMNNPNIDAVVIGMKSQGEVDENIAMINRALAA